MWCLISGLEPGQPYDVRVSAKTRAGFGSFPENLKGWVTVTTNSMKGNLYLYNISQNIYHVNFDVMWLFYRLFAYEDKINICLKKTE